MTVLRIFLVSKVKTIIFDREMTNSQSELKANMQKPKAVKTQ